MHVVAEIGKSMLLAILLYERDFIPCQIGVEPGIYDFQFKPIDFFWEGIAIGVRLERHSEQAKDRQRDAEALGRKSWQHD